MTFPKHIMTTAELGQDGFPIKDTGCNCKRAGTEYRISSQTGRKRLLGHRKIAEANRR